MQTAQPIKQFNSNRGNKNMTYTNPKLMARLKTEINSSLKIRRKISKKVSSERSQSERLDLLYRFVLTTGTVNPSSRQVVIAPNNYGALASMLTMLLTEEESYALLTHLMNGETADALRTGNSFSKHLILKLLPLEIFKKLVDKTAQQYRPLTQNNVNDCIKDITNNFSAYFIGHFLMRNSAFLKAFCGGTIDNDKLNVLFADLLCFTMFKIELKQAIENKAVPIASLAELSTSSIGNKNNIAIIAVKNMKKILLNYINNQNTSPLQIKEIFKTTLKLKEQKLERPQQTLKIADDYREKHSPSQKLPDTLKNLINNLKSALNLNEPSAYDQLNRKGRRRALHLLNSCLNTFQCQTPAELKNNNILKSLNTLKKTIDLLPINEKNFKELKQYISKEQTVLFDLQSKINQGKILKKEMEKYDEDQMLNTIEQLTTSYGIDYIRHMVASDGDCGYTAFGITREHAFRLLIENINKIRYIIKIPVKGALLTEDFFNYLKGKNAISENITLQQIENNLDQYAGNLTIILHYLNYDVKEKQINAGWAHPAILQALAEIRDIELHIWQIGNNAELIPHSQREYASYIPITADQRRDILFVNGNHFEMLDLTPNQTIEITNTANNQNLNNRAIKKLARHIKQNLFPWPTNTNNNSNQRNSLSSNINQGLLTENINNTSSQRNSLPTNMNNVVSLSSNINSTFHRRTNNIQLTPEQQTQVLQFSNQNTSTTSVNNNTTSYAQQTTPTAITLTIAP